MILSGCVSTEQQNLSTASKILGQTQARVTMAELPPECREHVKQVHPKIGEKPRWTQKYWENEAKTTDLRIDNCAAFYDQQKRLLQ